MEDIIESQQLHHCLEVRCEHRGACIFLVINLELLLLHQHVDDLLTMIVCDVSDVYICKSQYAVHLDGLSKLFSQLFLCLRANVDDEHVAVSWGLG